MIGRLATGTIGFGTLVGERPQPRPSPAAKTIALIAPEATHPAGPGLTTIPV